MSFQMCPNCFAELFEQIECSFCGHQIQLEVVDKTLEDDQLPAIQYAKFELTGMSYVPNTMHQIPKGTLFISRYSLLQFKQNIAEGACYIAYDHWLGKHTFLTLWDHPNVVSQYHHSIVMLSSIYDSGLEPSFSVFLPQEGLPLELALQRVGWNSGRVWEVFRQVCQMVISAESNGNVLPIFPNENLWVRPDGIVEFSIQPHQDSDFTGTHIQQLVSLLGWLYNPTSELDLGLFPLRLRPILLKHWSSPCGTEQFWDELDTSIRSKGWFRLSDDVKQRLLDEHFPNRILLLDDEVEIPNSVQLCIWNGVSGTWRLKSGRVLLQSTLEALLEVGVLDTTEDHESLGLLETLTMGEVKECDGESLESVLMHLRYGNPNEARLHLANHIRQAKHLDTWMKIAETLFVVGDHIAAMEIVNIAAGRISFVREALQLAALVCWNTNDIRWIKQFLLLHTPTEGSSVWDMLDWVEGWVALLGAVAPKKLLQIIQKKVFESSEAEQTEWLSECSERFGNLKFGLFPALFRES